MAAEPRRGTGKGKPKPSPAITWTPPRVLLAGAWPLAALCARGAERERERRWTSPPGRKGTRGSLPGLFFLPARLPPAWLGRQSNPLPQRPLKLPARRAEVRTTRGVAEIRSMPLVPGWRLLWRPLVGPRPLRENVRALRTASSEQARRLAFRERVSLRFGCRILM